MFNILELFLCILSLDINWDKSLAYWYVKVKQKPKWLETFRWKWVGESNLSKLMGTSFELNVDTKEINQFLVNRLQKKLKYLHSRHIPLTKTITIVKSILFLVPRCFSNVWVGTKQVTEKCKALMCNFLWFRGDTQQKPSQLEWLLHP